MAAPQIFKVLTEFRFEIGSAVASSNQLSSSVDKISDAANNALFSFQKLSFGIVSGFISGPGGGILGALGSAITSSDEFTKSQVGLATVMGRSAGTFAERMSFAADRMGKINKLAREFSLPGESLLALTKVLTPALAPKLGGGAAVDASAELGRVFLKGAPALGLDTSSIGVDQLRRAVLGLNDAGGPLFTVLTQDTKAMSEFVGKAAKFKSLSLIKRVDKLTAALGEFANQTSAVDALVNTVSGQMRILREQLSGTFSVLKPLGDVLKRVVIDALKRINAFIGGRFSETIKNLARILEPFTRNAEDLLVTLMQLKELKADSKLAGRILLVSGGLIGLSEGLAFLGIKIPVVSGVLGFFASIINTISTRLFFAGPALTGFTGLLNTMVVFLSRIFVPLAALIFFFQLLSRTFAIVKIEMAKTISFLTEKFSKVAALFSQLAGIFLKGFDALARFIAVSPLVDAFFGIIEFGIDILEFFTNAMVLALGGFQGFAFVLLEIFELITTFGKGSAAFKGNLFKAFDAGAQDIFEQTFAKVRDGDDAVLGGVTQNIAKVEINQDFKEKFSPDRIAFTVADHLRKIGQNATRGRGQTLAQTRPGN